MWLHLAHPELPTCEDCKRYVHNSDWKPVKRRGMALPVLRPHGSPTPCHRCPKAVEQRPNPGADFRGRVARAYRLFLAIRAGLPMPDDALVIRNCATIQHVHDQFDQSHAHLSLLALLHKPGGSTNG